jgi:hypothetical protein
VPESFMNSAYRTPCFPAMGRCFVGDGGLARHIPSGSARPGNSGRRPPWDDPVYEAGEIWSHYLDNIVIWALGNPPGIEQMRKALASVDPDLVLYGVDSYDKVVRGLICRSRGEALRAYYSEFESIRRSWGDGRCVSGLRQTG